MLHSLELTLLGRHHSGIDDCRNICRIAIELIRRGAVFHPTKQLNSLASAKRIPVRVSRIGENNVVSLFVELIWQEFIKQLRKALKCKVYS